jgi:hypothetical protein
MKYSKLITVSASVLAVAALSATQVKAADTATNTAKTTATATNTKPVANVQSITIKAASGDAAHIYTAANSNSYSGLSVDNGQKFAVQDIQLAEGTIWFKIGTNQWIKSTDADYQADASKTTDTKTNTKTDTSKTDATKTDKSKDTKTNPSWVTVNATGTVTIKTKDGEGVTLYSDPDKETKTGRVLKDGTSWKVLAERNNGELWLNLGGKQWIRAIDTEGKSTAKPVVISDDSKTSTKTDTKKSDSNTSTSSYTKTAENGVATVTYKTPIVVWAELGAKPTKRYLKRNTSWKYFAKTTVNGETWYNLGGNQWIPLKYIRVSGQQTTQADIDKELAQRTSGTVVVAYATPIVVWAQPGKNPTKKYLGNKTAWHFYKKTEVNGTTWYNLGGDQWVPSTYVYVRFKN